MQFLIYFSEISQCVGNGSQWPDTTWGKQTYHTLTSGTHHWTLEALECWWKNPKKVTHVLSFCQIACSSTSSSSCTAVTISFPSSYPQEAVSTLSVFILFSYLFFLPGNSAVVLYPLLSCFLSVPCLHNSFFFLFRLLISSPLCLGPLFYHLPHPHAAIFLLSIQLFFFCSPLLFLLSLPWVFDSFYKHPLKAPVTGCC